MEKCLISIIVFLVLLGCSEGGKEDKAFLPEIIVETNKDTLRVGEEYIAKIFLSNESLLFLEEENGKKKAILPIFRINGEIVETNENYFLYKEVAKNGDSLNPAYSFKEWDCAIIFPHPKVGAVELSLKNSYVIEK